MGQNERGRSCRSLQIDISYKYEKDEMDEKMNLKSCLTIKAPVSAISPINT